jgi:hypothetical protein
MSIICACSVIIDGDLNAAAANAPADVDGVGNSAEKDKKQSTDEVSISVTNTVFLPQHRLNIKLLKVTATNS